MSTPRPAARSSSGDERTDLAWNRSGLAIVGCGLVVMRGLTLNGFERSDVAVGAVILVLGFASYLLAGWHGAPAARAGPRRAAGTTGRSPAAGDRRDRDRRRRVRARPAVPRA